MKVFKISIIVIFTILFLFTCSKEQSKDDTLPKCIVTFIEGKSYLINEENSIIDNLNVGKNLNENDIIRTEKKSTVELLFGDNSIVRLKENSILKLLNLFKENEEQATDLFLNIGKILANPVQQVEGSSFEIETKSVTVGVRGTEFTVITDPKSSKVAVNTGKVIVKNKIKIDAIENIKDIDSEIAEKIDSTINSEIILSPNEKIEINNDELKEVESDLSTKLNEIVENLDKIKESKKEIETMIENIEKVQIKEISKNIAKVVKKEKITQNELVNEYNIDEFENIKERRQLLKQKKEKEKEKKEPKKEDLKTRKKYESLFQKSHQLYKEGKKEAALKLAKDTLSESKKEFGVDSRITAHAMFNLAILSINETDQLDEVEKLLKDAIKIYEKFDNDNDFTIPHLYKHYAELFCRKKEYDKAIELFNKSILISEEKNKNESIDKKEFYTAKASALKGLASVYSDQSNFKKSEVIFNQAITIIENNDINNNRELISVLQSYKNSLEKQNKISEVQKINKKIISIMENDPDFKNGLVRVKKEINKRNTWDKYEALFEKVHQLNRAEKKKEAIKMAQDNLKNAKTETGEKSRITAHAMQNLANLYIWQTNQFDKAEILLKDAIKIYEKNDEKDDPTICHLYNQYAELFLRKKEYENAKSYYNKSIKIYNQKLKDGANENIHFFRAKTSSLRGLANIFTENNDYINADKLFKQAIIIIEKGEGKYSNELKYTLEDYKRLYIRQNKMNEVDKIDKRILLIMENNPDFKNELIHRNKEIKTKEAWKKYEALFKKVNQLNQEGKKVEAIKMAKDNLADAKREVGENSRIAAHAMQNLAGFYIWETNQFDDAEALLKDAIDIYENIDDINDSTICHLYNQYGELYFRKKQYENAKRLYNKSINLTEARIEKVKDQKIHYIRAKANALNGLATLFSEQNDFKKSEELYKKAISFIENNEGENSKELIYILQNYLESLKKQNKKSEAENITKRIRLLKNKNIN